VKVFCQQNEQSNLIIKRGCVTGTASICRPITVLVCRHFSAGNNTKTFGRDELPLGLTD